MTVSAGSAWVREKMWAWVGRQQMTVSAGGAERADESADGAEGADESADGHWVGRRAECNGQRPTVLKGPTGTFGTLAAHLVQLGL